MGCPPPLGHTHNPAVLKRLADIRANLKHLQAKDGTSAPCNPGDEEEVKEEDDTISASPNVANWKGAIQSGCINNRSSAAQPLEGSCIRSIDGGISGAQIALDPNVQCLITTQQSTQEVFDTQLDIRRFELDMSQQNGDEIEEEDIFGWGGSIG